MAARNEWATVPISPPDRSPTARTFWGGARIKRERERAARPFHVERQDDAYTREYGDGTRTLWN